MGVRFITSRDNPVLKTIRLASAQSRRVPEELVVAEGVRLVEEAMRNLCPVEALLVSESFGANARERTLLDSCASAGVRIYRAGDRLYQGVSGVVAPQGAVALVRIPVLGLAAVMRSTKPFFLCACEIQDPGNLGSLIRTAAAAGCSFVCATPGTVSARNPKTIRASAGAFFRIAVVERVPPPELLERSAESGVGLYRASASEGEDITRLRFPEATGILLGNEGQGFGNQDWSNLPAIRIPMASGVESLNVAAAGAVIAFEVRRHRVQADRHPVVEEHEP